VTLTATDVAGHVKTCTFKLDVRDNEAPEYRSVATQQGIDASVESPYTCSTSMIDSPETNASDNVEILMSSMTATHIAHYDCAPNDSAGNDIYTPYGSCDQVLSGDSLLGVGSAIGIGIHQIRYDMLDTSQNPQTITITVICRDKTRPVYQCPNAITVDLPADTP